MAKIDYKQPRPKGQTKPGTQPQRRSEAHKPGRNKKCKYYDKAAKTWHQPRSAPKLPICPICATEHRKNQPCH